MIPPRQPHLTLSLHGLAVKIASSSQNLTHSINQFLQPFLVTDLPSGIPTTSGNIVGYETDEVLRHLSVSARRLPLTDPWLELYHDDERFWLVDDRWGIAEINFLRNQWRTWILPEPTADPVRLVEGAVLWPLAQLLRPRGLHLLPAISIARDDWGILILAPFSLEPELVRLLRAGYRVIGQRWTALREEDGRIHLLHMPGVVERAFLPRLRIGLGLRQSQWVNIENEFPSAHRNHACCRSVLIMEPGRRSAAHASDLSLPESEQILRADWPIVEVHPSRRHGLMPQRIANLCQCSQVQLSRNADDLLVLLDSLRDNTPGHPPRVALFTRPHAPRLTVHRL